MKKDIDRPLMEGVTIAIKLDESETEKHWTVHLINSNSFPIENIIVASKGYGKKEGDEQQTSTLRHFYEELSANSTQQVEVITKEVFHLFNEYWVSYYVDGKLYDKKFTFVPKSINSEHLTFIDALNSQGILHA
jgi:hypothetical protein